MRKSVSVLALLFGMSVSASGADDAAIFGNYQAIVQSESDAPIAMKKGRQFITSLGHDDFVAFIREAGRHSEYTRDNADAVAIMAIFAMCYKDGPGKGEPLILTLKQMSDATLPVPWKIGLLEVLKPEKRLDLNDEEVAAVISTLGAIGNEKHNSDVFRAFCLQRLGNVLSTQCEVLSQLAPELKDAVEKQDRSALPTKEDASVTRAARLIDAIRDYKIALQKAVDEVKDEQIKANLTKRGTKWEPRLATPST